MILSYFLSISAYEKGHTRPALSVHTFTAHGSSESSLSLVTHISGSASQPVSPCCPPPNALRGSSSASSQGVIYARPPLPVVITFEYIKPSLFLGDVVF